MTNILNYKNVRLLAILPVFLLTACIAEPETEDSYDSSSGSGSSYDYSATMCYDVAGNTMTVRCIPNSSSSCSDYGQSSLGSYPDWSSCDNDVDDVLDNWADNGTVVAGPSAGSGGSGSGGGSGGSGSGGSGTYDYSYTCPTGETYSAPIPIDQCSSESEYFARTFGCNQIDDFADACYEYYGCLGVSQSELDAVCGSY
ncbi:MAG: hypothetical protein CMI00_03740 [Oceanospirillaceae bacterium]|nr:hypothetical protein [Oceanospirillaceae bacterium]|tara:strand:- start:2690 stop:3286 length:597 start_codon:yes stop_codon:yes gene_type:complete